MKAIKTDGMMVVGDKLCFTDITVRTEVTGDHKTLSLSNDDGLLLEITCNDKQIKRMLKEVSK